MNANPLLDFSSLPRFDRIEPAHVLPAIDTLLERARAAMEAVATDSRPATWETVIVPTEEPLEQLDRAWSAVRNLNAVVNTPALRDAYNAALPKVTAFYTDVAQDVRLFERFRALAASPAFAALDAARRRLVENELRDFRRGRHQRGCLSCHERASRSRHALPRAA